MAGALRASQSAGILVSSETEGTNISPRTLLAEAKGEPGFRFGSWGRVGNFMGFHLSYDMGIMSLCVLRSHSSRLRLGTESLQAWMMT